MTRSDGHRDYGRLLELIDAGHVRRANLSSATMPVYQTLIEGHTAETLDDGEASTIAYAQESSGIALIDERKARTLASSMSSAPRA
jgi:predicted nucleic acid-binding protein